MYIHKEIRKEWEGGRGESQSKTKKKVSESKRASGLRLIKTESTDGDSQRNAP